MNLRSFGLLALGLIFAGLLVGCGGNSGTTSSTGGGNGGMGGTSGSVSPPTSGEYLWELGSPANGNNPEYAQIDPVTGAVSPPVATTAGGDRIAVHPSGKYLYTINRSDSILSTFRLQGPGLQTMGIASMGFNGEILESLTMHPSGKFLYMLSTTGSVPPTATIREMTLDPSYGIALAAATLTETADLRMTVVDPSGKFLFANDLSGGRIFAYQIDQTTGALTPIANSPLTLPANQLPAGLVLVGLANSAFLYAELNNEVQPSQAGIAAFSIDRSTGALTTVPGSPFLADGRILYTICADPLGRFLYGVDSQTSAVHGMMIDPSTGELGPMTGSPFALPNVGGSVTIDPGGKFLYVDNANPTSTIYGFSLDSTTGQLTALSGTPFPSAYYASSIVSSQIP